MNWRVSVFLLVVVAAPLPMGCSSEAPQSIVKGAVTLDGAPLADGLISFTAVDLNSQTAEAKITEGRYEAAVPPGEKRVEIRASKVTGKQKMYDTPDSPMVDVVTELLPARYNVESELRITVTEGEHEHSFELKSK